MQKTEQKHTRSTFNILFYINRSKIKADGTTAILCRISIDGKQTVLTTGIYCRPEEWNPKKGELKITDSLNGNERKNNQLQAFRKRIERTYETILREQGVISAELLKNTLTEINKVPTMLLEAGEEERERLKIRSAEIKSTSTYRQSKISQSNLREYLLSLKMKDIAFSDITESFGENYKLYLKSKEYRSSHINHCFTWLNRLIYIAVDREIIRFNPLADIPYEKKEAPKLQHISRSQLKTIMDTPLPDKLQELTRRAFIFSAFTALAYADVKGLYPHHIEKTAEGKSYIRTRRKKTDVEAFIPLHPIAEQILSLYNTEDDTKPIFPLPNRDRIWYCINEIGFLAGVKGNLSYHQSRHTFGTLLLSAGIPIESISKMMGHSNISSTQVYAKVTDDKISEDMDKLIERRKVIYK
ncbi:site-specific integrase [Dysgonomonas sp. Marseille-P4677]|uniref:site-specific integrase n=1 Tax=Dysgonomonas sp. Marseille-P4677 TaxID=2364790 RepID=UPI001914AD26|nr:site-specific integrase [Dysgonomonas sp. Marseille-P4677]MBK5722292.1 site-specific integrase [Dysgonomonas sp. Marseille-P4677]